MARVTWRAAGYAANLARGQTEAQRLQNENAGAGGVEIARNFYLEAEEIADKIAGRVEAVHEAAGEVEVVAGGSSIRLLIRV